MKILVIGRWNPKKLGKYVKHANDLGKLLAERGHTLVASPSSGFQGLVAKSYKENNGTHFIGYYPNLEQMNTIGEVTLIEPDERIYTDADYPIRNILQIKGADCVIAVTGGAGVLTEIIASVKDYNLPLVYYDKSSSIVDGYFKLDDKVKTLVHIGMDLVELLDYLESKFN